MTGSLKVWNGVSWEYAQLGQAGVVVQASAPSTPTMGQLWMDSDDTAPGASFTDTGWIEVLGGVGFLNGWVNFDTRTARYRRLNGVVFIDGIVKTGTVNTAIFNLPVGYRPRNVSPNEYNFATTSNALFGSIAIRGSDGAVIAAVGSNIWFQLSCCFIADA